jgi:hypothetical protein
LALIRAPVSSIASARNGSGRFRKVVQDIPLIGNGTEASSSSSASSVGCVNGRHFGRTPPATSFPSIRGGGKVSGTLVMTMGTPAAARSVSIVVSLIER